MGVGSRWVRSVVVLAVAVAGAAVPAFAQPSFQWLGNLPDTTSGGAKKVSRDGSTVLGECSTRDYLWRSDTGLVEILIGGSAEDLDEDGDVVVGRGLFQAIRWTAGTGPVALGDLPEGLNNSWAFAVSPDGSIVYGMGTAARGEVGTKWTDGTGMVDLGMLARSHVRCATSDGSVLAGYAGGGLAVEMMRFTAEGGVELLGDLEGGLLNAAALDISDDGETIVGIATTADGQAPAMWTHETGLVALQTPATRGAANAISPDGELIVGGMVSDDGSVRYGLVWDVDREYADIHQFLRCRGVELDPGSLLTDVTDIAMNGTTVTLVGRGCRMSDGIVCLGPEEGWIATYPYQPPHVECRRGNIGLVLFGCPQDVLFVNGSVGSLPDRVVGITPETPLTVRMETTMVSGNRYALYLWAGQPTAGTVRRLPLGTGTSGMPMPMTPGAPQPRRLANNIGKLGVLGVDTWPGPAPLAPATLLDLPGGLGKTGTFYLQGLLLDGYAPNGIVGVTNGIVLVSQP